MKNNFMLSLVMISFLLSSFVAEAGGLISLKGNLLSCDKIFCKLKVETQVYKIELARLPDSQKSYLTTKKREDLAELSISLSAIKDVTDYKL